jgi:hypothetical protein
VFLNYRKSERSSNITKLVGTSCYHMYRLCARIEKISSKLGRRMPITQTSLCVITLCYHIDHMWRCLGFKHLASQLTRNLLSCCTQPLHVITWLQDKFHNFRTSFGFYIIYKYLFRKLFVLSWQEDPRYFISVPGNGLNIHQISWISFFESPNYMILCTCSSNLKYAKKSTKQKKLRKYN